MPRERLSMRKVREVLRLKYERKLSNRAVTTSCRLSVGSVHDYLQRARVAGLSWPLPECLSDEALDQRLFPPVDLLPSDRALPDWEKVAVELRRKGMTLSLREGDRAEEFQERLDAVSQARESVEEIVEG